MGRLRPAAPADRACGRARSCTICRMIAAIRFSGYLQALALEIRKSRSGERSELRLLAGGARLLERSSYRDLSVEGVCTDARLAKGTFYIYFASKDAFL